MSILSRVKALLARRVEIGAMHDTAQVYVRFSDVSALIAAVEAAHALSNMYGNIWDRVDGAITLLPPSVPKFEELSGDLVDALAALHKETP